MVTQSVGFTLVDGSVRVLMNWWAPEWQQMQRLVIVEERRSSLRAAIDRKLFELPLSRYICNSVA